LQLRDLVTKSADLRTHINNFKLKLKAKVLSNQTTSDFDVRYNYIWNNVYYLYYAIYHIKSLFLNWEIKCVELSLVRTTRIHLHIYQEVHIVITKRKESPTSVV